MVCASDLSQLPHDTRRVVSGGPETTVSPRRGMPVVPILAISAFVAKVAMAFLTYGTNDVTTWQLDLDKANSQGAVVLIRDGVQLFYHGSHALQIFSHPPSMIHILRFWGLLVNLTHLPLQFWMRFSCATADAGSLLLLSKLGHRVPALRFRTPLLALIAACPISIEISGFHGNTDPIMMFFLLGCVYVIETKRSSVIAGALMGLALSIKIVPVIFIPAAILYLTTGKSRVQFTLATLATFLATGLPWVATEPGLILHTLSGYNGLPSLWSDIAASMGVSLAGHKAILLGAILSISLWMNLSKFRPPLFAQCGFLTAFFLFFAPGFAVQYLAWTIPWFCYLGITAAGAFYLTAGSLLFVVYSNWSGGLPWYHAHAVPFTPSGNLLYLICLNILLVLLLLYLHAWNKQRSVR